MRRVFSSRSGLALAGAAFVLVVLAAVLLSPRQRLPVPADEGLAVMTYNVGDSTWPFPRPDPVARVLRRAGDTQVFLLQETGGRGFVRSLSRAVDADYHILAPYKAESVKHLAIISRLRLHNPEVLNFSASRLDSSAVCAEIEHQGQTILVCSVHLDPVDKLRNDQGTVTFPPGKLIATLYGELFTETPRSLAVRELLDWLSTREYDHAILAGDFNTIAWSRAVRQMDDRLSDALQGSLDYYSGTFSKVDSPILPRIDYVFHTPGLVNVEAAIIKDSPGDHYPIRAVFGLR
jgi:endonuclease/exonuclease/phosphatase (EEP) superfamily protein YafD